MTETDIPRKPGVLRQAFRALISHYGDMAWVVAGSIVWALIVVVLVSRLPVVALLPPGRQDELLFMAPVLAANFVLACACLLWLRATLTPDAAPRSIALAIAAGVALLGGKWLLKHVFIGDDGMSYGWAFVVTVCVVAPIVEESFFRGLVWRAYRDRGFDDRAILLAVSALFVVAHLPPNLPILGEYTFMALSLGLIRYFSGGVYLGMLFHALMNAIVLYAS